MKLIVILIILFAAAALSGCVGKGDAVYSVSDVYENPGMFIDSKGAYKTIKIQGIPGTDPIYDIGGPGSYYFLVPEDKNAPPNEIIYVSTANGAPPLGSAVVVQGKIEKIIDTGKLRIVTFIPENKKQ